MFITSVHVIPRPLLSILVFGLPVLVVAFAVVMGGYALSVGVSDTMGAGRLWWTGVALLMVMVVDLILLIGALGLRALDERDSGDENGA